MLLFLPTGCAIGDEEGETRPAGTAIGIDVEAIDKSIDPGNDFYRYANGNWLSTAEIPPDRTSIGAFDRAGETVEARLAALLEEIVGEPQQAGTPAALVRAYYRAYTDRAAIERAGLGPVRRDLARFAVIDDKAEFSAVLGQQMRADVDPLNNTDLTTENLFGLFVTRALGGEEVLPYLLQGGLGLPSRDAYLSGSAADERLLAAYRDHVARIMRLAGFNDPVARADAVVALEAKIAQAHVSRERSDDWASSAAVWSRDELEARAPGIDWERFLTAAGLSQQERFSAFHADAITGLSALVASEPLPVWRDWLAFHQINSHADVLPRAFDDAHFAFYGRRIDGRSEQRPLQQRAIRALNRHLGDALGQLYVGRYFDEASRRDILRMVAEIKQAFAARIRTAEWLDDEARAEALRKVRSMEVGIGYPDGWTDYGSLDLSQSGAYAATIAAERAAYRRQLAKIGEPLDPREWWIGAQEVNALNLPVQNALNFPAAILVPPFYDPRADPAANYGAIGAIIGHEISHSLDNKGANFDGTGLLRDWWSAQDREEFSRRADVLAEQFSAYRPFRDAMVDGRLTLGENIADLAGLAVAYDAYRASLNGKEPRVIEGFTGEQRFFIAWAQLWARKIRDEALRNRLRTDGHAPSRYRALTVRNIDAWYKAFDVQQGDRLYLAPADRARIW